MPPRFCQLRSWPTACWCRPAVSRKMKSRPGRYGPLRTPTVHTCQRDPYRSGRSGQRYRQGYSAALCCGGRLRHDNQSHGGRWADSGRRGQGIGTALYEHALYDENGQFLTGTLMDYLIPTAIDVPQVEIGHIESPSPHTPHGIKGVGEGGRLLPRQRSRMRLPMR